MDRAVGQPRRWRGGAFILLAMLFLVAVLLDHAIAHAAAPHHRFIKHDSVVARLIKELGTGRVVSAVIVLLCLFHARRWFAGALVLASAGIGGLLEVILKWSVGRTRPVQGGVISIEPFGFDHFRGGPAGFLHQSNLCFPSGHATLAFATAACLAYLLPRWKVFWFLLAALVGAERIAELAHYPSDVVGGAICGVLAFQLSRLLLERYLPETKRGQEPFMEKDP
jgi:membrane-associated phospholipid phosphatase